jgi:hypothetical protein
MEHLNQELQRQLNKRLTLNLLIQGVATHSYFTTHHLVKEELDQIDPNLIPLYDRISVSGFLAYWLGDLCLVCGTPTRFWARVGQPQHPFARHPLLVECGAELAAASYRHARERAKAKGVSRIPGFHYAQLVRMMIQALRRERKHQPRLEQLARQVAHAVWGIDEDRLHARLTTQVEFGQLHPTQSLAGRVLRRAAIGYGGVLRDGDSLKVVARAWIFPLLCHELVKGTAELICLHGMNRLDRQLYDSVTREADRIEYELWLMQAGAELWRRLLRLIPPGYDLAEVLMQIARLEPDPLERLMRQIAGRSDSASRQLLALLEQN